MKLYIKCFSTLADNKACGYNDDKRYDLADGQTVHDLTQHAGIDSDSIKIAFVNNRTVDLDTQLFNGDRVGLAPFTGGM